MSSQIETILSSSYKKEMVAYLSTHTNCLEELIEIALTRTNKLAWRAAWMIHYFMDYNDVRLESNQEKIIQMLPNCNESLQREFLKVISKMNINVEYEGLLLNHCFTIWEDINKSPSVRYHALKTVMKIAVKYNELISEIEFFTQEHYLETLSPTIKKIILKEINTFYKSHHHFKNQ